MPRICKGLKWGVKTRDSTTAQIRPMMARITNIIYERSPGKIPYRRLSMASAKWDGKAFPSRTALPGGLQEPNPILINI